MMLQMNAMPSEYLSYLRDLLFDLSDSAPYYHAHRGFDQPKLRLRDSVRKCELVAASAAIEQIISDSARLVLPV